MRGRLLMALAWPAFIAACLLQGVVFAVVDPHELHWAGRDLAWSRQAVYAAGFFLFWLAAMVSSVLTATLLRGPEGVVPVDATS
jgi:hypothetical protein